MVLTEKEVSLLVDGLRCAIEKWQGMVDEAAKSEDLRGHALMGMLSDQIERAEELKEVVVGADTVAVL